MYRSFGRPNPALALQRRILLNWANNYILDIIKTNQVKNTLILMSVFLITDMVLSEDGRALAWPFLLRRAVMPQ